LIAAQQLELRAGGSSAASAEITDASTRRSPHGKANTITAEVPEPPKKPDTTPEVVATYCLPST
jgi:hypothetical protein